MDSLCEQPRNLEASPRPENPPFNWSECVTSAALLLFMGAVGVSRSGPYAIAIRMYPRTGGGGINLLQKEPEGRPRRLAALDFHPLLLDRATKTPTWSLHMHLWPKPKEHRIIFDTRIRASAPPKQHGKSRALFAGSSSVADANADAKAHAEADEYCRQQLMRPSPF